jgi:predicted nucleic acid-binding protein
MPPVICIDASVGVKWFLSEEADSAAALALLERFVYGDLNIVVPELFFYEMGSALSAAVSQRRIPLATAIAALDELERLNLTGVTLVGESVSALLYSQRFGLSVYDASYLATAESRQAILVTGDERLLQAVKGRLQWVVKIDRLCTAVPGGAGTPG